MYFASDNSSPVPPEVMAALTRANDGYERSYGNDAIMGRVRDQIRTTFDAPEAAVYLVATGTAANALAISLYCPPWGAVLCHVSAHIAVDECGAPEFFAGGSKLVLVDGQHGKLTPDALTTRLAQFTPGDVHGVQRAVLSITNVTEAGTVYTPAEVSALTTVARANGMASHMDGARFANAIAATGATPAEMTWRSGIDVLSFGGTKNGLLGVEAVVIFDPAKAWEFELRRKRAGHLFSKHRYLSAQMEAYLTDGLWQRLATQANTMGVRLATGLEGMPDVVLKHPVQANMLFPEWHVQTEVLLLAAGAVFSGWDGAEGRRAARLVASWSTTDGDVDRFLTALRR
jgi:threonine aldolase